MAAADGTVSAILVTHNSSEHIDACLVALTGSDGNHLREIIVVDNASTDQTPTHIARRWPSVTLVLNRTNEGFAAACNRGAQAASGAYLLFVNPDVVTDSDMITELMQVAAATPQLGLAVPRLRHADGRWQANCRAFPSLSNLVRSRGSILSRLRPSAQDDYTIADARENRMVPSVAGTVALIRKARFDAVGGFDHRFFLFVEDTDLSRRLADSDYVNVYVPSAGALHHWGRGSTAGRIRRMWHHHRSMWRYFLKHDRRIQILVPLAGLLFGNFVLSLLVPSRAP